MPAVPRRPVQLELPICSFVLVVIPPEHSECCFDETLLALRFAECVREMQNGAAASKEELLDAEALSDDGRVIPASIDRQEEENASGASSSRPA
mmetsp:Transcript_65477/g.165933  ORF Transcript_65477/g.165933 Transcript_65477/m.165933 type:complete len:94 (+) Transcript_65477:222-503(+)